MIQKLSPKQSSLQLHFIRLTVVEKEQLKSFFTFFHKNSDHSNSSASSPQGKSNNEAQQNPSMMYVQFTAQEQTLFPSRSVRSTRCSAKGSSLLIPPQPVRQSCHQWAKKWRHLAVLRPLMPRQLSLWGTPSSPAAGVWEETLVF